MTKPNDLIKAAAVSAKSKGVPPADPKKAKALQEAFPFLSAEESAILLQEYNGSIKLASEAALNGERWTKIKNKKPKREEKSAPLTSPVETRAERPPRKEKDSNSKEFTKNARPLREKSDNNGNTKPSDKEKAAAATQSEAKAIVHQTGVSTTSWAKGGVSFADMLKKQAADAAAPVETPPVPSPAAPSPKVDEGKRAKKAPEVVDAPAAVAAATTAPTAEVPLAPDTDGASKKPRRDRKPQADTVSRDAPPKAAPAAAAAAAPIVAPAPAAAPAAAPAPAPAVPTQVKYVLEVDRIAEPVTLPSHVVELAQRVSSTYTFDGTPGRAPTPPQPPIASTVPPQHNFTMLPSRQTWNGADNAANNMQQQQQQQRMNQQPIHTNWDNHSASAWSRPTGPANFTSYQSPYPQQSYRQQNQGSMNYRYSNHHNVHSHHHQRHPEQVASDAAYSAIRDDQSQARFNGGVW